MAPLLSMTLGLPTALISWPEVVLILLAVLIFGVPIFFRVARALRSDDGGYR